MQNKRLELCEWCKKREPTETCTFCGGNICVKCTVETINGEYYCKSCQLSAVKSDQACD